MPNDAIQNVRYPPKFEGVAADALNNLRVYIELAPQGQKILEKRGLQHAGVVFRFQITQNVDNVLIHPHQMVVAQGTLLGLIHGFIIDDLVVGARSPLEILGIEEQHARDVNEQTHPFDKSLLIVLLVQA